MTGEPSYLELGVPDVAAARAFYSAVLGWQPEVMPGGARIETDGLGIGLHGGDDAARFEVFFAVDDLDAAVARLIEAGGGLVSEIQDVEGFGRYVECRDDQDVRFGLRQSG